MDASALNAWRVNIDRRARQAAPRFVELVSATAPLPPAYRVCCGLYEVEVPADFDDVSLERSLRLLASC